WIANPECLRLIDDHGYKSIGINVNLPAVTHQNIQTDGRQRKNEEWNQDSLQKIVRGHERNDQKGHRHQCQDEDAVLADGKDLLIRPVRTLELTVLTIIHSIYLPSVVLVIPDQ